MYVYAKSKKDLRLTIDWGDGIVEDMSEKTGSDIRFLDYGPDYDYSGVIILHKYEGDFVNRKNVVTIYGDQYFMCRGYYYGLAPYFPGKQLRNIISRAFAEDLPVAVNLKNVSSLANESDRVLKLSVPYGYRNAITNCSNAFINCINLLEAAVSEDSIGGNPMYSDSNLFMGCSSLTASTYRIPPYFTIGGTKGGYYDCAALSADIKDLLPKGGFYSADAQ